uniref:SFRICE_011166 n=1 Tax=Spodoptera frugiperda TaxID=7108 RepID=A0A2H1VQ63_SPOFR
MADDNTIIEGTVKFRDGKKWKSRWCVMRKLSPVADCVHLQLYRDSKARCAGAASKASLSLQHYLGSEAGFTLDKHSNTLALVCRDLVAILAFETRERLIQWQVKVGAHLGEPRHYLVLVGGAGGAGGAGNKRLPAGPARLHLHERRFALTAGVPPRLLGIWELPHLRRYGVVEGRFCFEGGSHCGKGEGLHVLITDQAKELARDFDLASQGRLSPRRRPNNFKNSEGADSPKSHKAYRPDTRLSELNTIDHSLPPIDIHNYEEGCEDTGAISPYWPSAERTNFQDMGHGDTASVNETVEEAATWNGVSNVTLERCMSCISKLGALSRSSTAALTPGAKHFNPAWTMEPVHETLPTEPTEPTQHCDILLSATDKTDDACHCPTWPERPPERPPKPTRLELNLNRKPVPLCRCTHSVPDEKLSRVGPYENYDVPKLPHPDGEYYDTPKRLKECLTNELFKVTKSSVSNAVILKKPCGCLLKFGKRRREPTIVDSEESFQPASCPCQRVTDWANNWIKLPYCRKNTVSSDNLVPNKENVTPNSSDGTALYATIDLSRKTRRKQRPCDRHLDAPESESLRGLTSSVEIDDGPLANYENLSFALSLEHYENAKDLLRKVGVTQSELDAISANLNPSSFVSTDVNLCTKCGHAQQQRFNKNLVQDDVPVDANDDYLMMAPDASNKLEQSKPLPAGYTPMSPIGGFAFNTLKHPARSPISRLLEEKSASNPTLCEESRRSGTTDADAACTASTVTERADRIEYRKRSSSADSSRFLEDVKEFDGSIGSQGSTSSIETLRNIAVDGRPSTPCNCIVDNKHSDADSSEASKGARSRLPPARRSSSVPGKAGGNRDSSSSNDSGVSSCSLRRGEMFELPLTTAAARRHYRSARRAAAGAGTSLPRRSRSTDPLSDGTTAQREGVPAKSSSAEAEVPVLTVKPLRGVMDTHSTSSGTSDMSDYIETLSICSSHSSTDTPITMRVMRQTTSTLRPRSGKEYGSLDPRLASAYRHPHHYTNLP